MIRAVLDTNVLASGLASPPTTPGLVLAHWAEEQFELVTSDHILDELKRTLAKNYFRRIMPVESVSDEIAKFPKDAAVIRITANVRNIATHSEDDLVLATAVSGNAKYLVTGDRQLLKLREYRGIRVITAVDFLRDLGEE